MEKPEILQKLFTRTATRFLVRTHRIIQRMPVERKSIQCSRVLVLAPHSDDEVISAGGVLALHQRAGSAVRVLCVSGDSNASPETLEARRMVEARTVAEFLGHELVFLEFPDGSLSLCERQLALEVRKHIDQFAPSIILVPFPATTTEIIKQSPRLVPERGTIPSLTGSSGATKSGQLSGRIAW